MRTVRELSKKNGPALKRIFNLSLPTGMDEKLIKAAGAGVTDHLLAAQTGFCSSALQRLKCDVKNDTPVNVEENIALYNVCTTLLKACPIMHDEATADDLIEKAEFVRGLCALELAKRTLAHSDKKPSSTVLADLVDVAVNQNINKAQKASDRVEPMLANAAKRDQALIWVLTHGSTEVSEGSSGQTGHDAAVQELVANIKSWQNFVKGAGEFKAKELCALLVATGGSAMAKLQEGPPHHVHEKERQLKFVEFGQAIDISSMYTKVEWTLACAKKAFITLGRAKEKEISATLKKTDDIVKDIKWKVSAYLLYALLNNKMSSQVATALGLHCISHRSRWRHTGQRLVLHRAPSLP